MKERPLARGLYGHDVGERRELVGRDTDAGEIDLVLARFLDEPVAFLVRAHASDPAEREGGLHLGEIHKDVMGPAAARPDLRGNLGEPLLLGPGIDDLYAVEGPVSGGSDSVFRLGH